MLFRVATGEEDSNLRIDLQKLIERITAGQPRHGQIENHEIDLTLVALVTLDGCDWPSSARKT